MAPQEEARKDLEAIVEQMQSATSQEEIADLLSSLTEEELSSILTETPTESPKQETESPPESKQESAQQTQQQTEEPVVEEEEEEEPTVEEPPEQTPSALQTDPVLRQLRAMTDEERVQFALANGVAGVLKLLELQRIEMEERLQALQREQAKPVLDQILADWVSENQDLLSDPFMQDLARGLDVVLMEKKGKTHYTEFSPLEFKQHLSELRSMLERIAQPKAEPAQPKESVRTPPSPADLGGGSPPQTSPVELLSKVADDSFKLEQLVRKLPESELDNLLAQLE